ncbi:MAG: Farnesyl diphosphate synthase [Phycisphaerae bacterium]|nr:Farnesyl diphosphate synthase [Phycisphaerae bacterium]
MTDWPHAFRTRRTQIDDEILKILKPLESPHSPLAEGVRYCMTVGGKRLRPILLIESCLACGGSEDAALVPAVAIECTHAFTLVHDDLPAMDDDDLRRGRPTLHRAFDEATAVLTGDWLLSFAMSLIADESRNPALSAEQRLALLRTLSEAASDVIVGQSADVAGESQAPTAERVRYIHEHKTARLIEAACRMGAIAADAPRETVEQLGRFGRNLGLAFQIADDLLDATGDEQRVGKRLRKDQAAAKQSYPAVFGLEASREAANGSLAAALDCLENLGSRATFLRGLAEFVVTRDR